MRCRGLIALLIWGQSVAAADLGTWGDLWPVKEPDMLTVIMQRLTALVVLLLLAPLTLLLVLLRRPLALLMLLLVPLTRLLTLPRLLLTLLPLPLPALPQPSKSLQALG